MTDVLLSFGADYPLSGAITNFEAYMFSTTPKHIAEHASFDEEMVLINKDMDMEIIAMDDLAERKRGLTQFNNWLKAQVSSFPKPTGVSCLLIDFMMPESSWSDDKINQAYAELKSEFISWMVNNNRVAAMVQHFYQGKRYPHVHILYQRTRGAHDEFQRYLASVKGLKTDYAS